MGCFVQMIAMAVLVYFAVNLGQTAAVNTGNAGNGVVTGLLIFFVGMLAIVVVSAVLRTAARSHR